jgi:hypothetical protein
MWNAHTELRAKRQRSAREAIYRNRPIDAPPGLQRRLACRRLGRAAPARADLTQHLTLRLCGGQPRHHGRVRRVYAPGAAAQGRLIT